MSTKKEDYLENEKRREELSQSKKAPVSGDIDVDFPATNPAAKQKADRIAQDADDSFSKPHPTGSNLATTAATTDPNPQSPAEFKESGGVKITDNSKTAQENSSGTQEKSDAKETGSASKTTAPAEDAKKK